MKSIWLSTENKHKLAEFKAILNPMGYEIHTPSELDHFDSIAETGETFAENAIIKAKALYDIVKEPVIADDSGLMVEALNNAPGIYSARYAGNNASDEENRKLLLKNMQNIKNRAAIFITVIAFAESEDIISTYEGRVQGEILHKETGALGFGYDNLFYSYELKKSFAEATEAEKNSVSHRFRAINELQHALLTNKTNIGKEKGTK